MYQAANPNGTNGDGTTDGTNGDAGEGNNGGTDGDPEVVVD